MLASIDTYLNTLSLLPSLRTRLKHVLDVEARCSSVQILAQVIPDIAAGFGVDASIVVPFQAAWHIMYSATSILDHLQDGDPVDNLQFAQEPLACQQTIALSLYVFASGMLDRLYAGAIEKGRVRALQCLWHASMLRMASGQYEDLLGTPSIAATESFEMYQRIAYAKTGSAIGLALGGTATLCTDDHQIIDRLTVVGEIIGLLLQMSDDALDTHEQANQTHTFMHAVAAQQTLLADHELLDSAHFAAFAYQAYRAHIVSLLEPCPSNIQDVLLTYVDGLFHATRSARGN